MGFTRRQFLQVGAGAAASWALRSNAESFKDSAFRIAFGSCNQQWNPQPLWPVIASYKPDLFLFLGDNVYGDTNEPGILRTAYETQARNANFAQFRANTPIVATWDDHDYGFNDCGNEYNMKEESKRQFLEFFNEPTDSERRLHPGVYTSYMLSHQGLQIQLILLDLRWFRSPLKHDETWAYIPNDDPSATILGGEQWAWLDSVLDQPADVRFLCSSIQFASSEHRWEKWANFPLEKQRLLQMIDRKKIECLHVLSGDMHFGELTPERTPEGRMIYDFTSSGLNRSEPAPWPNSRREAFYDQGLNFGLVTIRSGNLELALCDERGAVRFSKALPIPLRIS